MICVNCHRLFSVRVPIRGDYFCRRDCYTAWSQKKNYARVQTDINAHRLMRSKGGDKPQEVVTNANNL